MPTALPENGSSWERLCLARKWDGETTADRCGRDTSVPRTPFPRKWLRGVKSAEMPLEPTPNHGTTPSPWGEKISRPPLYPSTSRGYEQHPRLALRLQAIPFSYTRLPGTSLVPVAGGPPVARVSCRRLDRSSLIPSWTGYPDPRAAARCRPMRVSGVGAEVAPPFLPSSPRPSACHATVRQPSFSPVPSGNPGRRATRHGSAATPGARRAGELDARPPAVLRSRSSMTALPDPLHRDTR